MPIKISLHKECIDRLSERIKGIRDALTDAQQAANQETKSSAGDKHETGRAMMQLETEKLGVQLQEVRLEQEKLQRIRADRRCQTVEPGALVITDKLRLYFAISAGKIILESGEYFALSTQTPLGKAALGLQKNNTFALQNQEYQIKEII